MTKQRISHLLRISLGICVAIMVGRAAAAPKAAPAAALTPTGEKLQTRYAAALAALQAEIAKSLPVTEEPKKAAFLKARDAVKAATSAAAATQQPLNEVQKAKALVEHAKGKWIGGAEKGIAQAEAALKQVATDGERDAARKELAKWQANKEEGLKALKERQAVLDKVQADESKSIRANEAAQAVLARAQADELAAAKAVLTALKPLLSGDKLDAKLVKCAVLTDATPRGLAEFAQQGKEQEALVEKLLADSTLIQQMLVADGAKAGKYGRAMEIYTAIQKASPKANGGLFQRLALAVSLEHAVPIAQSNPEAQAGAPATVDPVKRYLHFEKAHLDGELDTAFKDLTVWEYRNVVNGDESEQALAWGREMLRNYRPDHVLNPDYGWRYSGMVRTDVKYGSQDVKNDRPTLQKYQNIVLNGGVCGRRAFFGRFILRSFGIPTVARPQTGHAALAHWTPNGWVINLGAAWGSGRVEGGPDTDFLLTTQARRSPADYLEVLRAQWVARALGEPNVDSKKGTGGWWHTLALYKKQVIAAETKSAPLAALGAELGEANETAETKARAVAKATATDADKKIAVGSDGAITIPAAACGGGNQLVKSFLGGHQMICGEPVSCEVDVLRAGKYALTARVVTVHNEQQVQLTQNNAKTPVDIVIPYTCGMWEKTKPVEITLVKGKNVLSVSKPTTSFAIKDFTLTPMK